MNAAGSSVSVVIPMRDEAPSIAHCIAAIAQQDHPLSQIEVIVVDGGSTDGSAERAQQELERHPFKRTMLLRNNAKATAPAGLNIGLAEATGEVLCRVDARSFVPPSYVSRCVATLNARPDVTVVGGRQVATAEPGAGVTARGIARALRNPVVTGLARYRRSSASGATDTVYLGAFRTEELRAIGGWDERFVTNQDYELNQRLRASGAVWFDAELQVGYRPRTTFRALASQYRRFGRWKASVWLEGGLRIAPRQAVLLAAPLVVGIAAVRAARSRGASVFGGAVAVAVLTDLSSRERASLGERAAGIVAAAVLTSSWWLGVVEQLVRHLCGERMLHR